MPIYEYTCASCNKKFDQLVRSMTSSNNPKCPECGSAKTARAMSVFAAQAGSPTKSAAASSGPAAGCGRCGGPGPCSMG